MAKSKQQPIALDSFTISVKDKVLSTQLGDAITELVVDTHLHLPCMFEIHLADKLENGKFAWIDGPDFKIGAEIKIKTTAAQERNPNEPGNAQPQTLITGEVTALECEFDANGRATLVVRGYDPSYRMHIGRKTATFLNMTDNAIIDKVARDSKLKAAISPTPTRHEYVIQNNQTDMDFVRGRAQRVGYDLHVDENGQLSFTKANQTKGAVTTLEWGKDLIHFHPTISAMQQTGRVIVRAWDVKAKTLVQSQTNIPAKLEQGGDLLDADYATSRQNAETVVSNESALDSEAAKAFAAAIAEELHGNFVKAEGMCVGIPDVRAGRTVKLTGLGEKFSGNYLITSATHHYAPRGGYTTSFAITGRHADTLSQLLSDTHSQRDGHIEGVVVGVITNNNDPLGLGRTKVKFPWLGEQIESAWCRMAAPMAGNGRGFYYIPEVNDEVLVAFEHGDPNVPYILGALWNTTDKPPKPSGNIVSAGKVNKRILRSRSGHEIVFCDEAGKESITIVDKTEKNKIVIDSTKKSLGISVSGDCVIKADGQCTIEAKQNIELKSTGKDVTIDCTNFTVKAKANCKIESSAQLDLESAMVNVKSKGPLAIDGKPVQINQSSLVILP